MLSVLFALVGASSQHRQWLALLGQCRLGLHFCACRQPSTHAAPLPAASPPTVHPRQCPAASDYLKPSTRAPGAP